MENKNQGTEKSPSGLWLQDVSAQQTLSEVGLKVLVLGGYGSGKSYFAKSFPEPIFLMDFDKGALGYAGKRVFVPKVFYENLPARQKLPIIETELKKVVSGAHEAGTFSTIVIDSLTTMMQLCMDVALEQRPSPDGIPVWNVHYPLVKVFMDRIVKEALRFRGHVVVISHIEYDKDDVTGEIIVSPAVTGKLKAYVPALFDEVYFAEPITKGGNTEYILRLAPFGFKKARSRLRGVVSGLPETIPNTYEAIASYLKKGNN